MVIPIPARLTSGRIRRAKENTAVAATTKARTNRRTPDTRAAFCSEIAKLGANCKSTTVAESNSMKLSEPNAKIAGLCADHPANDDTPNSISIHATVTLCNHKTDEDGTGLRGDLQILEGCEPIWTSSTWSVLVIDSSSLSSACFKPSCVDPNRPTTDQYGCESIRQLPLRACARWGLGRADG